MACGGGVRTGHRRTTQHRSREDRRVRSRGGAGPGRGRSGGLQVVRRAGQGRERRRQGRLARGGAPRMPGAPEGSSGGCGSPGPECTVMNNACTKIPPGPFFCPFFKAQGSQHAHHKAVTKAVFPSPGLGTRLLPAYTKAHGPRRRCCLVIGPLSRDPICGRVGGSRRGIGENVNVRLTGPGARASH